MDYEYDAAGRVSSITRRVGPNETSTAIDSMSYAYDSEGNKTGETLHEGQVTGTTKKTTTYSYDAYNRLQKLIHADNTDQEYLYDGAGNSTTLRDEKYPQHNQATAYVYDGPGSVAR